MGQRTRMAKTGSKIPISRDRYRQILGERAVRRAIEKEQLIRMEKLLPDPVDNAGGRARYAAKHAAQPWVKYLRTEQSIYTGPKTAPPTTLNAGAMPSYRRVGGVWKLIATILGR